MPAGFQFNPPPGWPAQVQGWEPGEGWIPDPSWPPAPTGWVFWIVDVSPVASPPVAPSPQTDTGQSIGPSEQARSSISNSVADGVIEVGIEVPISVSSAPVEERSAVGVDALIAERRKELAQLDANIEVRRAQLSSTDAAAAESTQIEAQLVQLNDALLLQQVGIYQYHHPLENAEAYRERLAQLNERIHDSIRIASAILTSDHFAYNNSLAQGRKMTADFSKLMLRAYNAEADSCIRSLRAGTSWAAIKRLGSAVEIIAKLGRMMEMRVSDDYHQLRVEEIELTSDYLMKVQEDKEAAREERERLREERKVAAELAAERERLNKERMHYENALNTLLAQGKDDEVADLQKHLALIDEAIAQNDYRAANIRAGYVYVISNIGAFGPNMVKIGLTRRLEPMDRIRELGDASVPFPFDVHAIYFSNDAVGLENQLHAEFATRRVNQVNLRREHFFATADEVRKALVARVGNLLEFTEVPEATQYNMSRTRWPEPHELVGSGPN